MTKKKFLDEVRDIFRIKHYSYKTEKSYIYWIRRFIFFHQKRHPAEMSEKEIGEFLSYLAVNQHVSASTQNQALNAIVFLYKKVLNKELGEFPNIQWAKRSTRIPVVLTTDEVRRVLSKMKGIPWLMTSLLYGSGLRHNECLCLRVKDIDFGFRQIIVRYGKGHKDRSTILPENLVVPLRDHLKRVRLIHQRDLLDGFGAVDLPFSLARKYPNAPREWAWSR